MGSVLLARRRAAHRSSEGGAVMFLVTMMLAVLASVGLYALAASTNEVIASGSERQATETHYLGELGVVGGAQYMSASTANNYITQLLGGGQPDTKCWSLPNQSVTVQPDPFMRFCTHVPDTEMSAGWSASSFGSFGSIAASTPDFYVEYTGLGKGPPPHGYQIASGSGSNGTPICFVTTTASSYGQTVPPNAGGGTFAEGLETQRARFNVGPVFGAECQ
jgi:hypothetical protein